MNNTSNITIIKAGRAAVEYEVDGCFVIIEFSQDANPDALPTTKDILLSTGIKKNLCP